MQINTSMYNSSLPWLVSIRFKLHYGIICHLFSSGSTGEDGVSWIIVTIIQRYHVMQSKVVFLQGLVSTSKYYSPTCPVLVKLGDPRYTWCIISPNFVQLIPFFTFFNWLWNRVLKFELEVHVIRHMSLHIVKVDQWQSVQAQPIPFRTNG